MKSTNIAAASSMILALVLAGPVVAAGMSGGSAGTTATPSFNDLDKDGNGKVSRQEAEGSAELINQWSQADSNGDNTIDRAEFVAFESSESSGSKGNMQKENMPKPEGRPEGGGKGY
jgi:hypothetical protein